MALVLAGIVYGHFLRTAQGLWYSPTHDRNAHLWFGLSLAIDIRTLDLPHFLKDLHGARIWGPLHPLLLGVVLAVGGPDERLAVLPSLACWVGSALFAFLAARRAVSRGGNLAGFVAALFVLASPAHRALAADIMLESLGACLSLGVLYFYQRACQERTPAMGACLGLLLTLLFFDKYNYWLLILLALGATTLAVSPLAYILTFLAEIKQYDWKTWSKAQLRHPLNYVLGLLLGVLVLVLAWPGEAIHLGSWRISTQSPHNLVSVLFTVLFFRVWPWWWKVGRRLVARLEPPARQLVYWHAWPVVIWFLWPQRLGNCLTYLTRNHGREGVATPLLGGLHYYWDCLADHYHQFPWAPWLIAILVGAAFLTRRTLRPGASLLLWVLVVAGGLTLYHPTLRSRFCHSWIAVIWVLAGIGLAQILYGRLTDFWPEVRPWMAGAVLVVLGWLQFPGMLQAGQAPEAGPKLDRPQVLDLVKAYLPQVADARHVTILSNRPIKFLTAWTFLQIAGRHGRLDTELPGFGSTPERNRPSFDRWLQTTPCDALVFLDLPPGSFFHDDVPYAHYDQVPDWLAGQKVFYQAQTWEFPQYGKTRVLLWKRIPPGADVTGYARSGS